MRRKPNLALITPNAAHPCQVMHPGGVKAVARLLRGQGVLRAAVEWFAAQKSPPLGWRGQLVGAMPLIWGGGDAPCVGRSCPGSAGGEGAGVGRGGAAARGLFVCAAGRRWALGFRLRVRLPEKPMVPHGKQRGQKAAAEAHPEVRTDGCCWSHRSPGRVTLADTQPAPRRRGIGIFSCWGSEQSPISSCGAELCWGLCKKSLPLQLTGGCGGRRGFSTRCQGGTELWL